MDKHAAAHLIRVLEDAKNSRFLFFSEFAGLFPGWDITREELDEILVRLESGGIEIVAGAAGNMSNAQDSTVLSNWLAMGNEDSEALRVYLREVAKVPPLTLDEERQLVQRMGDQAQSGSEQARNRLIEANLSLVVYAAQHYPVAGMDFLDLIEKGNAGLIEATVTFDVGQGYRFATHAAFWVHRTLHTLASKSQSPVNPLAEPA